jgi:hypothetical protein
MPVPLLTALAIRLPLALLAAGACTCVQRPPHQPMGSPIEMAADGPADNNFCYVCHINMKREPLVVQHRTGGVGCMKCHGFSDAHSGDEDGVTPPQVMFPAERINRSCVQCHNGSGTLDYAALDTTLKASPKPNCTSCHGEHRLAIRTRRWDKATGKLIYDDGVRMTSKSGMNNGGMQ